MFPLRLKSNDMGPIRPKSGFAARAFGYDIFISFALGPAPRGTQSYASDLARRLRERDIAVFFSEEQALAGQPLTESLRKGSVGGPPGQNGTRGARERHLALGGTGNRGEPGGARRDGGCFRLESQQRERTGACQFSRSHISSPFR